SLGARYESNLLGQLLEGFIEIDRTAFEGDQVTVPGVAGVVLHEARNRGQRAEAGLQIEGQVGQIALGVGVCRFVDAVAQVDRRVGEVEKAVLAGGSQCRAQAGAAIENLARAADARLVAVLDEQHGLEIIADRELDGAAHVDRITSHFLALADDVVDVAILVLAAECKPCTHAVGERTRHRAFDRIAFIALEVPTRGEIGLERFGRPRGADVDRTRRGVLAD
ncbi:MAG: hypothetical protein ACK559_19590, partial [bacterium]